MQLSLSDDHPIFEACKSGDYVTVEYYLKNGISVYAESDHNPAIFGIVANRGHRQILELMIRYGLDIRRSHNRFGSSVAEFAIHRDSVEWLEYFFQLGVPVDVIDNYNSTLLNLAAGGGKINCLKRLLVMGLDLESKDYLGGTPLCYAAWNNQITAMQILVEQGANIEARDSSQTTPLIGSAKGGKFEAVEWLLDHGADINAVAERGKTALDWAKANGHQKIVDLLQSRMGS